MRFLPRAFGLTNTTVTVADLLAHTNYTFEIEAQNAVSSQAPMIRHYAAVTITTNQAGESVILADPIVKGIVHVTNKSVNYSHSGSH